jgi:hypothetical protein
MNVKLAERQQTSAQPFPDPDIDVKPASDQLIVIMHCTIVDINQIKHGVVGTAFLKIQLHNTDKSSTRIAFVPLKRAHLIKPPVEYGVNNSERPVPDRLWRGTIGKAARRRSSIHGRPGYNSCDAN